MNFQDPGCAQARVSHWLKNLAGDRGNLGLDAQGNCYLATDQGIDMVVSCGKESRQFTILSHLLNFPIPLSSSLYEEILALNLNVEFTSGGQVCFDKRSRALCFLVARDIDLVDEINFINILGNFQKKTLEIKELIDALIYGDSGKNTAQNFYSAFKTSSVEKSWGSA